MTKLGAWWQWSAGYGCYSCPGRGAARCNAEPGTHDAARWAQAQQCRASYRTAFGARRAALEHALAIYPLLLFRAVPDHTGIALQRHQRLAGVGPFLQFLDRDVIERLPSRAARKQRARDIDHVRRARAFVGNGRAAVRTEATYGLGRLVLVARETGLALGDTKTFAPASDIGRIRRAMRAAARRRMIVPGPARRHVDLERDLAAQALPGSGLAEGYGFGFLFLFEFRKHLE